MDYKNELNVLCKISAKTLKALIDMGVEVDVNVRDRKGETALHYTRDINLTRALIDAKIDIHRRNDNGDTPLHVQENLEVIKVLIAAGADVNARNNSNNRLAIENPLVKKANNEMFKNQNKKRKYTNIIQKI